MWSSGVALAACSSSTISKGAPVRITLIDRRNHHLFQPLLYQVATTLLATSEIAWPIRSFFRDRPEVTTLLAEVVGVDSQAHVVTLKGGETIAYDTLVLATGATHAYFGHDEWEPVAPGLKTLEDATTIRRRVLLAFEQAELESDPAVRDALLTFIIVGAGPTGVELAGIIAELARTTLPKEFRNIDTTKAKIILVEAGPRVLRKLRRGAVCLRSQGAGKAGRRSPHRQACYILHRKRRNDRRNLRPKPYDRSGQPAYRLRRRRNGWALPPIVPAASWSTRN